MITDNPALVYRACERVQTYLEDIRNRIRSATAESLVAFDFDTLVQLLTPDSKASPYSGILWHTLYRTKQLQELVPTDGLGFFSLTRTRVQIPAGARRELQQFCRKIVFEYEQIARGPLAQKLGVTSDDIQRLMTDSRLPDDDFSQIIRRLGSISRSLTLLGMLLENFLEFSPPAGGQSTSDQYYDYVTRMGHERPQPEKRPNNEADALNLTYMAELHQQGLDAYLVSATRAVFDIESGFAREPLYFALEFVIRKRLQSMSREDATERLDLLIARLAEIKRFVREYSEIAGHSGVNATRNTNAAREAELLGRVLAGLGDDPILKEISSFLSEAASAAWSAQHRTVDDSDEASDVQTFKQLQTVVARLRRKLGRVPRLTEHKSQETSKHLSYSLLDSDGGMLFAADLYGGDDLAIAWPTEVSQGDFCAAVREYYSDLPKPENTEVLLRLAGVGKPVTLVAVDLRDLEGVIFKNDQGRKLSLIKVACDHNIFWHDSSSLYAFDDPIEAAQPAAAKVAVSIGHKDQLKQLTQLYLTTTNHGCAPGEARRTLQKLLTMEAAQ